jgi:molybdate transport system substrate-binding protein
MGALAAPAWAAEAQVAVAANFAEPIKAIAAVLQKTTGHGLKVTLGATGKLYAQIQNGAPFDVLLSADTKTPQRLEEEGLAVPGSRFTYAVGKLVLWSAQPGLAEGGAQVLLKPEVRRVAYAAPKIAPYGAAAVEALNQLGMSDAVGPKLVQGESISQAHSYVYTGNAELGFLALSQVMEGGRLKSGSLWVVPASLYSPIRQDAVLLKRAADNPAALALLALLKSPRVKDLVRSYGYEL